MEDNNTKRRYDSVHLRDSIKVTDIIDAFGKLRYKVSLTSFDIFDDMYGVIYQIQVVNMFSAPDPLIIVLRPAEGAPPIADYREAVKLFDAYVKQYEALVRAQVRDLQDIDVYKERIGYEITCPRCCLTCKYCIRRLTPQQLAFHITGRLECTNPKNQVVYNFDARHSYERDIDYIDKVDVALRVNPHVDPFGVCRQYVKAARPFAPAPYDSIIDQVNSQVETIANSAAKNSVSELSGSISDEVTHQIDEISIIDANG